MGKGGGLSVDKNKQLLNVIYLKFFYNSFNINLIFS